VDFVSTAHATAALINPHNHNLNGRSLLLEYASPDAARRGGYRPISSANDDEAASGNTRRHPGGKGERKVTMGKIEMFERRKRRNDKSSTQEAAQVSGEGQHHHSEDPTAHAQAWKWHKLDEAGENRGQDRMVRKTKFPGEEKMANSKHRRAKPGAALAMAKRETVAIVPSTGTRVTFS
jgi:hypothetical protein